ncbi:hypothetical protein PGT21_021579 [Puccinia graminis f. sp. tritici]|uniref:Uncharacterized protein n=1 Tax=Puccinia graminis f. sp. tritici TaxID=56615 RepID=A0A5B0P7L6_PUCGR|nr:hypothetical protein PGT21_021579 [Puccinia graminis f. sp. tritici]KAA1131848.1 hypothetical protein PGTUg99_030306 [Puccinia graminis f. sp. tritici]
MRFAYVAGALVIGATVSEARAVPSSPSKRQRETAERVEVVRFATPSRISRRTKLADWNPTSDDDASNKDSIDPLSYRAGIPGTGQLNPSGSTLDTVAQENPQQLLPSAIRAAGPALGAPTSNGDIQYTIRPVVPANNRAAVPISDTPEALLEALLPEAAEILQPSNPTLSSQIEPNVVAPNDPSRSSTTPAQLPPTASSVHREIPAAFRSPFFNPNTVIPPKDPLVFADKYISKLPFPLDQVTAVGGTERVVEPSVSQSSPSPPNNNTSNNSIPSLVPSQGSFNTFANNSQLSSNEPTDNSIASQYPQASAPGSGRTVAPPQGNMLIPSNSSLPINNPVTATSDLNNTVIPQYQLLSAAADARSVASPPGDVLTPSNNSPLPNIVLTSATTNLNNSTLPQYQLSAAPGVDRTFVPSQGNLTSSDNNSSLSTIIPAASTANSTNSTILQDQPLSTSGATRTAALPQVLPSTSGSNSSLPSVIPVVPTQANLASSDNNSSLSTIIPVASTANFTNSTILQDPALSTSGATRTAALPQALLSTPGNNTIPSNATSVIASVNSTIVNVPASTSPLNSTVLPVQ